MFQTRRLANVAAIAATTSRPKVRSRARSLLWPAGGRGQILAWACSAAVLLAVPASGQEEPSPLGPDSLFGLDRVIDVHFELAAKEWEKLQPPAGTRLDDGAVGAAFADLIGDALRGGNFRSEKSTRPGLAGYLGLDHQYGRADVTLDGQTIRGVGLRYKGNGTFIVGHKTGKYPFKIDFNEYRESASFRGLTKVNLNNNATDPSMMREALSYELFREAGIACSRVGFARLTLTVPGQLDRESKGLYTIVEQVDKRFLKGRFGGAKGLLLKPSTFGVFRYLGEDWAEYETAFVPKTESTEAQQQRVMEFARLLHKGDDAAFEAALEEYLDVDQFLRFLAINVLLSNLDSFLGGAQNHYIYLEPQSNQFRFLPWDMDISFGAFDMEGTPSSRRNLSIDHPQTSNNPLIERVLAIERHKQTYHDYLAEYLKTVFGEEKLRGQIDQLAAFLRPLMSANGEDAPARFEKAIADAPSLFQPHALKFFVTKRHESVRDQLAGQHSGDVVGSDLDLTQLFEWFTGPRVAVLLAFPLLLLLNGSGWLWGVAAGFRNSTMWGLLNALLFPVCPLVYGFFVHRELGRRAGWWVLFCAASMVAWLVLAAWILMG